MHKELERNLPGVVAEIEHAFDRYNRAIDANDIATLDLAFARAEDTVRFGLNEELWSYEEIERFRRTPNTAGQPRTLGRTSISTFGENVALTHVVFTRPGISRRGRQTQVWCKLDGVWQIVSAHVSLVAH